MSNEFKVQQYKDATVYTLESASGGSTSAGSVASVSMPIGGVRKRGDNLIAQEADKNTVPSTTPRNFVAKNAKMGGAGAHRDKKKEQKQGVEKHKKPYMEDHADAANGWGAGSYDTYAGGRHGRGVAENPEWYNDEANSMSTSQLKSLYKHAVKLRQAVKQMQAQGDTLEPWQQSKVTKAADYLDAVFNAVDDEHDMGEDQGVAEGLPQTLRKVVPGHAKREIDKKMDAGKFGKTDADKDANFQRYKKIQDKIKEQGVAEGMRKWLVIHSGSHGEGGKMIINAPDFETAWELANEYDLDIIDIKPVKGVAEGAELKKAKRSMNQAAKDANVDQVGAGKKIDTMKNSLRQKDINKQGVAEEWSQKYKSSINCSHPKGFSQKAHCAGKKKHNESVEMEMTCPDCGMCQTHGDNMMEVKQRLDAKCWTGKHKEGTKIKGGVRVNNCVPNEGVEEGDAYMESLQNMLERSVSQAQHNLMVGVAHNPQFAQQVKVKQKVGQEFAQADVGHDISKLPIRVPKKK